MKVWVACSDDGDVEAVFSSKKSAALYASEVLDLHEDDSVFEFYVDEFVRVKRYRYEWVTRDEA